MTSTVENALGLKEVILPVRLEKANKPDLDTLFMD